MFWVKIAIFLQKSPLGVRQINLFIKKMIVYDGRGYIIVSGFHKVKNKSVS